ncbi:MAG TPA: DUF1207 domain-containing protein [Candidatus Methylomirabilis sp.]|nr:DUF1207 domain-containing protein [Candidatus Methylomirabilis sp.]
MQWITVIVLSLSGLLLASPLAARAAQPSAIPSPEDAFIAGYATALLEREFKATARSISVNRGVITLEEADLAGVDRESVVAALASIRGVQGVTILPSHAQVPARTPVGPESSPAKPEILATGFLPSGLIFNPLIADPRWPHFYASYQNYVGGGPFDNVGSVGFGETIVVYRGNGPFAGQWETGLQAGVFSIFDLDADSKDLINADYFVGFYGSYGLGPFQGMARLFHQSSHLGDEFLLRELSRLDRLNLSYESVDLKLSYYLLRGLFDSRFDRAVRVYAGAGYLFDQEPSTLKPWSTQAGVELQSPWVLLHGLIRPVAAIDIQNRQENSWSTDISLRAGLAFESFHVVDRRLMLLFEYFSGNSPNGQFYRSRVEYFGVGLHLFF